MSAGDSPHRVEVFRGEVIESPYVSTRIGTSVVMARCSCGWSVVRQLESATRTQVAKHRQQVAA